jgi:hypothetical protein
MTRRSTQHLAGLVVAALVAATGLVGLSSGPASAATCPGAGVNVVVDFHGLGGGVQKSCDPRGANRSAREAFRAAGFTLVDAPNQRGFVCQIDAKPADGHCQGTSSYWGLYWSDGKSGKWTYATTGVDGLKVPNGGFVAFAWQGSTSQEPPGATPVNNNQTAPAPKPTKAPPKAPSGGGSGGGGGAGGGGGGGAKPTKAGSPTATAAKPSAATTQRPAARASARAVARAEKLKASASARPSASASASATAGASASATPSTTEDADPKAVQQASGSFAPAEQDSGLPVWVPIVVILGLGGAAGGAVWWRRRTGAA